MLPDFFKDQTLHPRSVYVELLSYSVLTVFPQLTRRYYRKWKWSMKQCLGGRLTQLVRENGKTSHPRHRITYDVWKIMSGCQVNVPLAVPMGMPRHVNTAVYKCLTHLARLALPGIGVVGTCREEAVYHITTTNTRACMLCALSASLLSPPCRLPLALLVCSEGRAASFSFLSPSPISLSCRLGRVLHLDAWTGACCA